MLRRVFSLRMDEVNLTSSGDPERLEVVPAAGNFCHFLGAKPLLGRTFLPEEERERANRVDKTIQLDGQEIQFPGERGDVGAHGARSQGKLGPRPPFFADCGPVCPARSGNQSRLGRGSAARMMPHH